MGKNGRKYIVKNFDTKIVTRRLDKMYREVLS
jgi:uncharacterized protein YlzI (FlbEa/FlbD family)